jgi:CBS domain-containing protein
MAARDVMQTNLLTIPATMPYLEIQRLFVTGQIYGAPVVDDAGQVVAVLSALDLLRAADQALDEDLDQGESGDVAPHLAALTALEMATPEVVWVEPDTPLSAVADRMRLENIHRVLVGTAGKLEGIVTTFDLLQAVRD